MADRGRRLALRASLRPLLTLWLGLSEKQFGRSNLPVARQEGSSARPHQDSMIDARFPGHDASWTRPSSAYSEQPSANNCTDHSLQWSSGQAQPCIKRYTITRGWPDAYPRHHTAETPTERTSSFPPGKFFTLHALLQTRTISRPWSRLQTVQPTLDVNKYSYMCETAVVSLNNPTASTSVCLEEALDGIKRCTGIQTKTYLLRTRDDSADEIFAPPTACTMNHFP